MLIRVILFKLPAILIVAAITFLSSRSTLPVTPMFPGFDKVLHFIAYGALAFTIGLWFSAESWTSFPLRNFLICTIIASVFGVIDEFHQYFVPSRVCDFWDWVADTMGGAAGAAFYLLCTRIYVRKNDK